MSREVVPPMESQPTSAGWRRSQPVRPVPQHDWQVELPPVRPPGDRWRPLRFVGLLSLLLLLMGAFLLVAVDAPRKTPLLIVTDLRSGPISQSPWLAEEIERLKLLDNTIFSTRDFTPASSVGATLVDFRQSLQDLVPAANQTGAVIVYVRLPGLVDDVGRPCLVPPQASLVRTEEWLPVEAILEHVAGDVFPPHVRRVVIFDRCQPASLWQAGVLTDTFAEQLSELMKRQHAANHWQSLAVLSDTTGCQRGWDSPTTGGSVFGNAVWSALAGRADANEWGGNGDQQVSLSELATFVSQLTSEWARTNRRQSQTPVLHTASRGSDNLFWAASRGNQQAWQAKADRLYKMVNRDSALQHMSQLWNERTALADQAPWRFDPAGWQQLHHWLIDYEHLIAGGGGAARRREDVERSIRSLLDQLHESAICRLPLKPGEARLHHRHLTRRVNRVSSAETERIAHLLDQVRERPSRQLASALLSDLRRNGVISQDWDLVIVQHLVDDAPDATWLQSELMSRTLRLMESLGDIQAIPEIAVSRILARQYQPVEADFRAILDHLFIGHADSFALARQRLLAAEEKLAACQQSSLHLIRGIHQRDRAAAELPRLAEWIYAPCCGVVEQVTRGRIDEWTAATKSWQQLEQAIENCRQEEGTAESVSLVTTLSSQLERELVGLWTHVDQTYDRLLMDSVDANTVAAMEHMLSTSLLPRHPDSRSRSPVEQRISLYELWQQAVVQLDVQHTVLSKSIPQPEENDASIRDGWMVEIARRAAPHPMSLMLSLEESSVDLSAASSQPLHDLVLAETDAQAALIRRYLADLPRRMHRDGHSSFDTPEMRDRAWQTQVRQVRSAAHWVADKLPCNPCLQMELIAWSGHLRQRAICMAEDFWSGPSGSESPFFVRAATDLLDAADLCEASFASSLTAAGKAEVHAIRQRLAPFQGSDCPGLRVSAVAVPQILATDELQTDVSVTRTPDSLVPSGVAAVFISDQNPSAETVTFRAAAEIPGVTADTRETMTSRVNLSCPVLQNRSKDSPSVRAVAFFRGHRFADDFQLAPTNGLTARSTPPVPSPTTVVVQSHQRRPNAILFILDSSASMTDTVAREGTRGSIRKLDAAVEAFTALLNDFAEQPGIHVGVMIYGHRVASGETAAAGIVRQPLYQQRFPFPATLQPYEDVETVLGIGRFGAAERGQIENRLRCLRPWGETPLYLSIVEGLRQFESVPSDVTKTMVVITDGLNYQFNPTPEKQTQLEDVLRSAPGRDVTVHLVGFGIADQQIEQARAEFSRISAATGGSSDVTVRDAGRLQAYLRSLAEPPRFSIMGRDGFQSTSRVGQPIMLPHPTAKGESFDLRFQTAGSRIAIVGGEKLVFRPSEDGTLRIAADLPERISSLQDYDSSENAPCELVASRPSWKEDRLTVRWSLRRRDGQFTPRPSIGYFRVQPLDVSGIEIGTAAVCMGPADLPGQPLPTWEFQIPTWPRNAVTARVQGWIANDSIEVDRSESCGTLLQRQQAEETWQALPIPNMHWQIRYDGASVTLIERYDTSVAEPPVWTHFDGDRSPSLSAVLNVERRFDAEHRLFVQTWNFQRALSRDDLANLRFNFTCLERLRSQSWSVASPLLLPVLAETLVIQPTPVMRR